MLVRNSCLVSISASKPIHFEENKLEVTLFHIK